MIYQEDFMDNREKRIAFAWMAIEHRTRKGSRPPLKSPFRFLFMLCFFVFLLIVLLLKHK
jgi:hypothetical protein